MKFNSALSAIKIAKITEKNNLFNLSDKFIKLAQNLSDFEELQKGQDLESGKSYLVPTNDNSIFDKVAKEGQPLQANVGGENVWVTHGSPDGFFILPKEKESQFKSQNPDFDDTLTLSEEDVEAGIKANKNNNNIWVNEEGWKKYVGQYWIGCFDGNRKGFGQYATSKGEIEVSSIQDPSTGQQKTILKGMPY